jgi:hypothetical protein
VLEWFKSESGQTLIAGGAGAAASALHRWPGFFGFLRIMGVGTAMAFYLGDYASPLFKWLAGVTELPAEKATYSGAFLVGATGIVLFETILLAASFKKKELQQLGGEDGEGKGRDND